MKATRIKGKRKKKKIPVQPMKATGTKGEEKE